jgi:hypothetical protein
VTLRGCRRGGNRLEERGFKRGGIADDRAYTSEGLLPQNLGTAALLAAPLPACPNRRPRLPRCQLSSSRYLALGAYRKLHCCHAAAKQPFQGNEGHGWPATCSASSAPSLPPDAIRSMRRVQYEELTEEQIEAARRRRQREVQKWVARCSARCPRAAACSQCPKLMKSSITAVAGRYLCSMQGYDSCGSGRHRPAGEPPVCGEEAAGAR